MDAETQKGPSGRSIAARVGKIFGIIGTILGFAFVVGWLLLVSVGFMTKGF